ncbi:protein pygopus-like [Haliotis rubra]|uniref:protein pygopus-like n=1 Tax=Haliotis rubra TaxID=36100 RepID=UPI001EE63280|nr:protein pygopus-like [Haliotis rubra]
MEEKKDSQKHTLAELLPPPETSAPTTTTISKADVIAQNPFEDQLPVSARQSPSMSNMTNNMPNNMQGNMPNNMPGNMPNNMPGNMPNNMQGNMPNNMQGNMPNNMQGNMHNNMQGNMPNNMQGNMPNNMQGNMPNNMPGNMPNNMPGNMPNNMQGNMGNMNNMNKQGHGTGMPPQGPGSGKMYPPNQPMVFNHSNPNAPPIYPCGICHKEVHDNDQAILCESGCNFWFHRICTGLTDPAFSMLKAEVYAEWVCDKCLSTKNIPLVKLKP